MIGDLRKTPWPWFGGKSDAAPHVWDALGDVDHYVEPFAGSLAVLLRRPHVANRTYHSETVNDLDGLLCNAWRAIARDPDAVAEAASWPVCEADLMARFGPIGSFAHRLAAELDELRDDAGVPGAAAVLVHIDFDGDLLARLVAGSPDSHGSNLLVGPAPEHYVALIDHGSAFAGPDFNPGRDKNSFVQSAIPFRSGKSDGCHDSHPVDFGNHTKPDVSIQRRPVGCDQFRNRPVKDLLEMDEFARAEPVNVHSWKPGLDVREQVQIPLLAQARMMPSLQ